MSFIYGIIDLNFQDIKSQDVEALADGLKWEGFVSSEKCYSNFTAGICTHPDRDIKAGIYTGDDFYVVADARIYKEAELKKTIEYSSVEEAFAKAFKKWGIECINHINGDFSVVIYDRKKNEVYLLRDHIGCRPLVYYKNGSRLIFASHEFGLMKSGLLKTSISEEKFISDYFRFKGNYRNTYFKDIFNVTPGYNVTLSVDDELISKIWKPENIKQNKSLTYQEAVTGLGKLIVEATLSRMEPVKTGVHVSGGIDSTGIACVLADNINDKSMLTGYSWTPDSFDGEFEGIDEREFIEAFSTDKGVEVKFQKNDPWQSREAAANLEFKTQSIELPTMKMAADDAIRIMFSGWGGDEFVSLSTRGTYNHLFFSFKWLTILRYIKIISFKSTIGRLLKDVGPLLFPFGLVKTYKASYTDWSKIKLLKPSFVMKHWKRIFFHNRENIFGLGNRTRFMINLLENYHITERTDSWAINAEKYGFEYKYPLLDKDLLEFWFSIPVEYTYRNMKSRNLYRESLKGIMTEKVRIRRDKGEALRIAYSQQNRSSNQDLLTEKFRKIQRDEFLPFLRYDSIKKMVENSEVTPVSNFKKYAKVFSCFRFIELQKKYVK
jgi:asparagine synthase (glutamine-hydrolysing)